MTLRQRIIANAASLARQRIGYGSPCYFEITEGRQNWTRPDGSVGRYSWCADFVTACGAWAGITDGRLLNRDSLNGFEIGRSIDMLMSRGRDLGLLLEGAAALDYINGLISPMQGGDAYVMEAPAGGHAGILSHATGANRIVTYDGNGPGGTTGVNTRLFGSTAQLVCVVRLGGWTPTLSATRPASYAPRSGVETFALLAEANEWVANSVVPRLDPFYNDGRIGLEV